MKEKTAVSILGYPLFDWLRFALASVVALGHSGIIEWNAAGSLAVNVFFALSGWLIGSILVEGEPKSLPRFYFNRVTRIWFPYFAAVAALYALSAMRDPITLGWFKFLLYDVTFTHNWFSLWPDPQTALAAMPQKGTGNHFWSIAVEEQFYLLAPALIYSNRYGRSPQLWAAISVCLIAVGNIDFATIAGGVGAACARRKWGDWHTSRAATVALAAVLGSAGMLLTNPDYYRYIATAFSVAVVLFTARVGKRGNLGVFFGAISYPMYLNSWIGGFLSHALVKHLIPGLASWAGYVDYICAVLIGAGAYLLVDRNVMASRDAWYSPRTGIAAGALAYVLWACGLIVGIAVMQLSN